MHIEEKILRSQIRNAIKIVKNRKAEQKTQQMLEESRLRQYIRKLIVEAAGEEIDKDPHPNTGINRLRNLFRNTNFLNTLKTAYTSLTTKETQRTSFTAHIINWMLDTLAPMKALDHAEVGDKPEGAITEGQYRVNLREDITIDTTPDDEEKFIDTEDPDDTKKEKESAEAAEAAKEEETMQPIEGADSTGRNMAAQVYPALEKLIVDEFSPLEDEDDQEAFTDWLIANTKLYRDRWEKHLKDMIPEPESEAYNTASGDTPPA